MAIKADYTSLSVVKSNLKITSTNEDADISRLITACSDIVDQYCQRGFGSDAGTVRLLNGNGRRYLSTNDDLVSVSLLEVAQYEGQAFTTIPSTDFFLEPQNENLPGFPYTRIEMASIPTTIAGAFFRGHRTVRITGTWGWTSVPASVATAVVDMVSVMHKRRLAGYSDTLGDSTLGTTSIGKLLPASVLDSLSMYRKYSLTGSASLG